MLHTPEIAIIEPNTLTSIGLRIILEELIPNAVIRSFSTFEALIDDTIGNQFFENDSQSDTCKSIGFYDCNFRSM
jgi:hypothetical protein